MMYISVAVDFPKSTYLTYKAEEGSVCVGDIVEVPLGRRKSFGVVMKVETTLDPLMKEESLKSVLTTYNREYALSVEQLDFYEWIAKYYHYPLGKLIFDTLPTFLKRPRKEELFQKGRGERLPNLEPLQEEIYGKISAQITQGFTGSLIHGVTGSGKTMIYLHLIAEVLRSGRSVLFLMPEINLTPQFLKVFETYLPFNLFCYNSTLSNSEKFLAFKEIKSSGPLLVLGVRSSVFLPFDNLGLIIVDEEHDGSFKQEDRCPYNARDLAHILAVKKKIPLVLGSATPSLESYYLFKKSNRASYYYFPLKERFGVGELPAITIEDLRERAASKVATQYTHYPLTEKNILRIKDVLDVKEQALLFINRLGYSQFLQCRSCGHRFFCPNCSIPMRYFKSRDQLECNLCSYHTTAAQACPDCGNLSLLQKGFGTEKVKEMAQKAFPELKIERFDRDEVTTFSKLESVLEDFANGKTDILVGTQMLSKGHNFEKVNTVFILGIDAQLNYPDFRSTEKAYQLLTQVSGRAGRFSKRGEVIIQTMIPQHPLFDHIKSHAFDAFYEEELEFRETCGYPPFRKLVSVTFLGNNAGRVKEVALQAKLLLDRLIQDHFSMVELLGPRQALIEKRVNKYSWTLLLRSSEALKLQHTITLLDNNLLLPSGVSMRFDVDPQTIV